jgi:hypothetical protein
MQVIDDTGSDAAQWDKLRRKLEDLRHVLVGQGSLVRKKNRWQSYWYLRYHETTATGRKQRSVYVGDDDNAKRVRTLLDEIRAPEEFLRETLLLANLARSVVRPLLRGGSRHGTD